MDIEKEREAFEAWYCRNHTGLKQSDLAKFRTLSGYCFSDPLKINISWEAWQAAKAQAVPKYHMENIRDALVIACDIKEDEGRFEDSLNYIHQAMIEAQEQNQ